MQPQWDLQVYDRCLQGLRDAEELPSAFRREERERPDVAELDGVAVVLEHQETGVLDAATGATLN